eukprot:6063707-Alexandrium_andersonii.AAC.1
MDFCFLAKDGSDASLAVLVTKGCDSQAILAHPHAVQRPVARRRSGPSGGEHSTARAPPARPAQDRQRAGVGRLAPG